MSNTEFYIRRLHSISGIVPIGLFLLEHTATISTAASRSAKCLMPALNTWHPFLRR